MTDHPKSPFNDKADKDKSNDKQRGAVRDRDNTSHVLPPPRLNPMGRDNAAPRGHAGIKQDLAASKGHEKSSTPEIKRDFQSIAPKSKDKDRGLDR